MNMKTFFPSRDDGFNTSQFDGRVIIVTRTKNRPVLLARAFASVLAQTYQNWHLYLVNDGGEIAPVEQLLSQYEFSFNGRVTVKHHPYSLGMEAASNSALDGSEGDFVVIHDDDDAWKPDFLAATVSYLEDKNNLRYAAVAANCEVVYEDIFGDQVIEQERCPWGFWKERVDFADQLRGNNFPPICLLIRKCVVDQIGLYNAYLPVLGDWDYNLRILMVGDIGTINQVLAYYHHRRPKVGAGNYGNSVISGRNVHLDYQVLYRNSILRKLFEKDPAFVGLAHLMLFKLGELEDKISQTGELTKQNIAVAQLHNDLLPLIKASGLVLRPLRWFWAKLIPVRKFLAKARGRI